MCRACIIGRYIVKEFITDIDEDINLFIGLVKSYDHRTKCFSVFYAADNYTEKVPGTEIKEHMDNFEHLYNDVSNKGQKFTRKQACPVILKAYRQRKFVEIAKRSNPVDLTTSTDTAVKDNDAGVEVEKITREKKTIAKEEMGARIDVMNVSVLRAELKRYNLNEKDKKAELQQRLCDHLQVKMPLKNSKKKQQKKHGAKWQSKELPTAKAEFTNADFNDTSLCQHLQGYSEEKVPEPHECHASFTRRRCGTWDVTCSTHILSTFQLRWPVHHGHLPTNPGLPNGPKSL